MKAGHHPRGHLAILLDRVAQSPNLPALRQSLSNSEGDVEMISQSHSVPEPFVAPTVEPSVEPGDPTAPVLLVSASAAVGKSYLSRYISAVSGNPLWDLSKAQTTVGTNFFHGSLVKAYGGVGFGAFEEELQAGRVTLVVDALDEALVAATIRGFEESITDLAMLLGPASSSNAKAVLFGRPEALDFAAVKLAELGIPWERQVIQFFTETEGKRFIKVIAESVGKQYVDADIDAYIDLVFNLVGEAVASQGEGRDEIDDSLRSFLGYAPVLDALARLAAEGNAHSVLQKLRSSDQEMAVWRLLAEVMHGILERESQKIATNAGPEEIPGLEVAFSPSEQVRLLLSRDVRSAVRVPAELSTPQAESLRDRVEQQMRDHAFIGNDASRTYGNPMVSFANVALRDFTAAWVLSRESHSEQSLMLDYYYAKEVAPSPLLLRMVMVLSREGAILPLRALGALLDSGSTRLGERTVEMECSVTGTKANSRVVLEAREDATSIGKCLLDGPAEFLSVNRSLSQTSLVSPFVPVTIGDGSQEVDLGPNVFVEAEQLVVLAPSLRVPPLGNVRIVARRMTGPIRRIRSAKEDLAVAGDVAPYPWSDFLVTVEKERHAESDYYRAAVALRRLTKWFSRSSMAGHLHYPKGALDTILSKNRASSDWFEYLRNKDMLNVVGYSYALTLPCDVSSVLKSDISDRLLRQLLTEYLDSQQS